MNLEFSKTIFIVQVFFNWIEYLWKYLIFSIDNLSSMYILVFRMMRFLGLFFLIFALVFSTDCISLMQLGKPCPMALHKSVKKQSVSKHHHPCHEHKQNSESETCGCQQKDPSQLLVQTHMDIKPDLANTFYVLIQFYLGASAFGERFHYRIFKIPPNFYTFTNNLQTIQSVRLLIWSLSSKFQYFKNLKFIRRSYVPICI